MTELEKADIACRVAGTAYVNSQNKEEANRAFADYVETSKAWHILRKRAMKEVER